MRISDWSSDVCSSDLYDQQKMLQAIGSGSVDDLVAEVVPTGILKREPLDLPASRSEPDVLADLRQVASRNQVFRSYIGQGYYGPHVPNVILRNILENPA